METGYDAAEEYFGAFQATFPAQINAVTLAVDGITWLYAWTEQTWDNNSKFTNATPGRSGTATNSPAYEINNAVVPVNSFVLLKYRSNIGGVPTYEFSIGTGASTAVAVATSAITSISGATPGAGSVQPVGLIAGNLLANTGPAITVHNIGPAIVAGTYVIIQIEPVSGKWFVKDCCGGGSGGCPCPCELGPMSPLCITIPAFSYSPLIVFPGASVTMYGASSGSGCIAVTGSTVINGYTLTVTLIGRTNNPDPPYQCLPNWHLYGAYDAPMPGTGDGNAGWYFDTDVEEDPITCPVTSNCSPFSLQFPPTIFSNVGPPGDLFPEAFGCQVMTVVMGTCGGSGSGGSGGGGCSLSRTSIGTASGAGPSQTIHGVTIAANSLLIVTLCNRALSGGVPTATFNGVSMTLASQKQFTAAGATLWIAMYYYGSTSSVTGDIIVTSGPALSLACQAIEVQALSNNGIDANIAQNGGATTPDTGSIATNVNACEYVQSAFLIVNPTGLPTWSGGFTSGGQDVSFTDGINTYTLTEGDQFPVASPTPADASLTGMTVAGWGSVAASFS